MPEADHGYSSIQMLDYRLRPGLSMGTLLKKSTFFSQCWEGARSFFLNFGNGVEIRFPSVLPVGDAAAFLLAQ